MKPKVPVSIFALGLVWAMVLAAIPAGGLLVYWTQTYQDGMDWNALLATAGPGALAGAVAYWRKNKALLELPPGLEMARELVEQSRTTQATDAQGTVTQTVKETQVTETVVNSPVQQPPEAK